MGNLPDYARDPLTFFTKVVQKYGDFVPLRFGPVRTFALHHPDLIEQMLVTQYRNFTKGKVLRRNRTLFGNGLLVSEGEFWRRQRKLAQPAFHRDRIAAYGEVMVECAQEMLAGWKEGEQRDLHTEMMALTLEIVTRTLFSASSQEKTEIVGEALHQAQESVMERMKGLMLLPEWLPARANRQMRRAVSQLDAIVYGFIRERREQPQNHQDLLSMLLQAQDEDDGSVMTDKQLRDEALTLYLAGHETTSIALTFAWYLLAQHPEAEARLQQELAEVLQGRPPTVEDRARLPFTEGVILETMRLFPPAWATARNALADCEIGGYHIPAKSLLITTQWVMHRDPRYFDDPEAFRPERWADDLIRRLPKHVYFPFGSGPRVCIGNTFALMEGILLLATIAPHFRFLPQPDYSPQLQAAITLRPRNGLPMRLCRP
jgi:cytochrome P450